MPATASQATAYWDADALRFRDQRGRFISPQRVREAVDAVARGAADELESLARRLGDGSIDLQQFQARAETIIKRSHLATAVVAKGGRDRMGPADFGRVGARLREEYKYLNQFVREIDRGEAGSIDAIVARLRMYGEGATRAYEAVRRGEYASAGYSEERRVLNSGRPCESCVAYAGRGWQEIGTLPNTGDECECKSNCKCTFAYRMRKGKPGDRRSLALPAESD